MNIFKLIGTVVINKQQAIKDIEVIKKSAEGASTAMGRSFSKFTGYVKAHSEQIKNAGKALTVFGGIATAAFTVSVKSAAKFEEELANVSTMLDESAMDILPKYRDGLQDLSMEFGESTETLSKGLYDILSASVPPAKALGVLEVSAKAASAGLTDTGIAADAVTTIMNSYNMEAEDAGMISDKLFAIVKRGKTTFGELAPSIGQVAATAAKSGLSFDELGASISTMTRAGINTHETMTSINGVLKAFLKPQEEAIKVAKKFGVELNSTTLKTEGLIGVMGKLKDASAEELAAIFGNIRGLKGMMAALGDAEGYAEDYKLMLESAGLTQEAFEKQSNTLSFQLKQLKQMFNVVKVEIGTALIPVVKDLTKTVMDVVVKVKDWIKENPKIATSIVKWAAAISGLMLVLGPLLTILPGLVTAIGGLTKGFGLLQIASANLTTTLGLTAPEILAVATAITLVIKATYGWITALKEQKKIKEMEAQATQAQVDAYEKFAEKLGVSVDKIKEWQKEGLTVTEMCKRAGYQMKETSEAIEENTEATDENTEATEDNTEATIDNIESKDNIMTASQKVQAEIENLTAEYQLGNKTLEDTREYNEKLIEKYRELIEKLKEEQKQHKEGTVEYQNYTKAINDTLLKIKELSDVTGTLMTASERVQAEIANLTAEYELSNKTIDDTKRYNSELISKYRELIQIYSDERSALQEGTREYQNYTEAINSCRIKIKELTEAQGIELTGLEAVTAELALLENKFSDVAKTEEYFSEKAKLLAEEYDILNQKLNETKFHSEEWYNLKNQIYDTEEAARALREEYDKLNYNKLGEEIDTVNLKLKLLDTVYEDNADSVEYYRGKIALLTEKHSLLLQQLSDLESRNKSNSAEWYNVKTAIVSVENEIDNLNTALYESEHPWRTFFQNLKDQYTDTIGTIQSGISSFVSTFESGLADAIYSLLTMSQTNAEIQQEMAETEQEWADEKERINEEYKQALIEKLSEYVDAKELQNMSIAELEALMKQHSLEEYEEMSANAQAELAKIDEKYKGILDSMESEQVTFGSIMENFWKLLVDAILKELARIAASWLIGLLFLGEGGGVGYKLGGIVKGYASGGKAVKENIPEPEYFQTGGPKGTDTVPAWLTPGEYVIDKQMTDFIRRTGAVTADLIRAIQLGSPTPEPSFAGGGLVSATGGGSSVELNIMPGSIAINTKYLDDRTIAQAGSKIFAEIEKQARNAGILLGGR